MELNRTPENMTTEKPNPIVQDPGSDPSPTQHEDVTTAETKSTDGVKFFGSSFVMRGNFVCHRDPDCRACRHLPFRHSYRDGLDSPHLSDALDIIGSNWVKIPRVFPDTPVEPWMRDYVIPDLDECVDSME
ncbi:protein V32 [Felid alphaherpesvirus 1]|uniref:Protein V32 n=1 Tax=Feline herpesvirus 1 TaxID=10334 RepID=D1FXV4_FHV1|nr:protein V32 [Felid alphaherpesvirus 1]AMN88964.1 protein V32 [synthetic construct]ACT88330.1 protein V32 [Felid alphaherpesvirus 1]ALJ84124.1 protein V32 [Felid alphaherpesvirus 1]ALJ84200.1 protein V32 [Felid alphaherpesvirus 1]ALJ84276.1 protein V32 [Felid alphaherpesvirus 1]